MVVVVAAVDGDKLMVLNIPVVLCKVVVVMCAYSSHLYGSSVCIELEVFSKLLALGNLLRCVALACKPAAECLSLWYSHVGSRILIF